ncbi:phage tail tube protein [Lysobacter sp. LF1]|uniref:Phage tail tube protein n=1 Tax=Lysobacter stagni TaxID=3045172 RepID=A0ABT6XKR8_9GAMM|nr:phage tail tube protein [Lysobacter sp. LF1]MDI9240737.1 phage tail tube protein [Lysobacter sp. LF1]
MSNNRVGGVIELKVDSTIYRAKGNFTYNLGRGKRDAVLGADGIHGYKEVPQACFIEGEITDHREMSLDALLDLTDATAYMRLANGKAIVLRGAWYASEGTGNTEEGNIGFRLEGMSAEEIA